MSQSFSSAAVRLLHITDFHLFSQTEQRLLGVPTAAALQGVLAHAAQQPIEFDAVLATGDISQDGTTASYQLAQHYLAPIAPQLLFTAGNHDQLDAMQQVLGEQMPPHIDIGAWRVVLLNTSVPDSDEGWLATTELNKLKQACIDTNRPVLVAMHHNPIPVGSAWLDPMMVANAQHFFELCAVYPQIRAVAWGHVHQALDTVLALGQPRRMIRLMASPATCFQFAPLTQEFALDNKDPGYRIIELKADASLTTQIIRVPDLGLEPDQQSTGY